MKILILGAGQVGTAVAENLVSEKNDITVVDTDESRLKFLEDRFDLSTVCGSAAHPSVLERAGIRDAEMVLAVTRSDEINLVACKLAATLFHTPTKVARVRAAEFLARPEMFTENNFAVDFAICPEQIITHYLVRLIEHPEALQVLDFANGLVRLVAIRAFQGGPLVGHELRELHEHNPNIDARVAAIYRGNRPIIPQGDTVIEVGDEVFFIAEKEHIRYVMREMRRMDKPAKRIMIAGGGNIGTRLAKALEQDYQVKLIELNKPSAQRLAAELRNALVLAGDATDVDLLEAEGAGEMDNFCALTNDDETNIMASLLAKRMGARKVIALINRGAYVDLLQMGQIDIALSPAQASIGTLLAHVRRGDVVAVHALRRGAAEALEIVAHGDMRSSKVVGRRIEEIDLPTGVTIGAIVRSNRGRPEEGNHYQVVMAHHDVVIEPDDHVIVFVVRKDLIRKVERLFEVGFGFF
ncbi:MAG: Trk system potassium transporter TrkA [Gammaproteobacteria bacterium]